MYNQKSFHILNCRSLESIQIGEMSFFDFSGKFELKNLPQLKTIHIGEIQNGSSNFLQNSFVVKGIIMILNLLWLDLPSLESITLGWASFTASSNTIIESIE